MLSLQSIKIGFLLIGLTLIFNRSAAQGESRESITIEGKRYTISTDDAGNQCLFLNNHEWDLMVKGTKFTSDHLKISQPLLIYIEIADSHFKCKRGIGFGCSIYEDALNCDVISIVNNKQRFCKATLKKSGNEKIQILFLDLIDWNSLEEEH